MDWIATCLVFLLAHGTFHFRASGARIKKCPDTVTKDRYTVMYGDSCYRFELNTRKLYSDAQEYCKTMGGNLVSIHSQDENDFILQQLKTKFSYNANAWIGLSDRNQPGHFKWEDGSPVGYTNYAQPNIYRSVRFVINGNPMSKGKWSRAIRWKFLWLIHIKYGFVCEVSVEEKILQEPTTTTTSIPPTPSTTQFAKTKTTTLLHSTTKTLPIPSTRINTPFITSQSSTLPSLAATTPGVRIKKCPDTVTQDRYTVMYGDSCYRFELNTRKNYLDAQEYCKIMGGNLASIHSQDENDFILQQLKTTFKYKEDAWIGLSDRVDENNFKWEDGSPVEHYTNFAIGEGSQFYFIPNKDEDCVGIDATSDGFWRDFPCGVENINPTLGNMRKAFICQVPVEIEIYPPLTTSSTNTTATEAITSTTTTTATEAITSTTTTIATAATTSTTATTATSHRGHIVTCAAFTCGKNCGLKGYKISPGGCVLCECGDD